jgi:hypothetical protein
VKTEIYYKLYNKTTNKFYCGTRWEGPIQWANTFSEERRAKMAMMRKLNRKQYNWEITRGQPNPINEVLSNDWIIVKYEAVAVSQVTFIAAMDDKKLKAIVNKNAAKINPTVIVDLKKKGKLVATVRKPRKKKDG